MSGASCSRALRPHRIGGIDDRAIEGDAGLQRAALRGIFPDRAAAAAEADDTELAGVAALRLGPGRCGVEIGQQLRVRLGVDDRQQVLDVGDLGEIGALAEILVGRDREGAGLGQAARDVLDVFVQAKDLHRDDDHGRIGDAGGLCEIAGISASPTLILASPTWRPLVSVVTT